MNLKQLFILTLFMAMSAMLMAQTPAEKVRLKKKRLGSIERYHANVGLETAFNNNLIVAPKISIGYGSTINLFNIDLGVKYKVVNSLFFDDSKHLTIHQTAFFVSAQCNVASWNFNCVYIGAEMDYCMPVFNKTIANEHYSGRGYVGVNYRKLNIGAYCEYDLAPMMNQKYVYESDQYDYESLRGSLFERMRVGISITYNFVKDI